MIHLARVVLGCSTVGAFPLNTLLTGEALTHYPDDQWLVVAGTVVPGTARKADGCSPMLTAHATQAIPTPQDAYEYCGLWRLSDHIRLNDQL
jgi:uncharacterized membrane protein YcgQ (UPF0703/DUF1980 family)